MMLFNTETKKHKELIVKSKQIDKNKTKIQMKSNWTMLSNSLFKNEKQ